MPEPIAGLDPADISALIQIAQKLGGGASAPSAPIADGGDGDIEDRLQKLAQAVQTAIDGNMQMLQIVQGALKDMDARLSQHDAAWQGFDGLAKDKERADGIDGLKAKHAAHPLKAAVANAFSAVEKNEDGTPAEIWPVVYDTLQQAKQQASEAEGGGTFDEDGYVDNMFQQTHDYMSNNADAYGKHLAALKAAAPEPPAAAIEVKKVEAAPIAEEAKPEGEAEEFAKAAEAGAEAARVAKSRHKK